MVSIVDRFSVIRIGESSGVEGLVFWMCLISDVVRMFEIVVVELFGVVMVKGSELLSVRMVVSIVELMKVVVML